MKKRVIICGAGGFIGSHLARKLSKEGCYVVGIDLKYPDFSQTEADNFIIMDLRHFDSLRHVIEQNRPDEIYQLAADMGGAGYIFTKQHDAEIVTNSGLINFNVAKSATDMQVKKLFFSSSACIYPASNQTDSSKPNCAEDTAYPATPDSEYGWEKIFSERLYQSYQRNTEIDVRIARFHNIFGEEGTFQGGREKAPAAICRKVSLAKDGDSIDIWGDGQQTRSFLYIDECLEGVSRLMAYEDSTPLEPLNIGSEEMVTIDQLTEMIIGISGKKLTINHINGPTGVRGRCSDNTLIFEYLGWKPTSKLIDGLKQTYIWIDKQIHK